MRTKPGVGREAGSGVGTLANRASPFFLTSVGTTLRAESNLVMLESHEAMVGDGYAMGIAGEIAEYMVGTAEGRLGLDDPVLTEQGAQEGAEGLFVFQRLENSGQGELVFARTVVSSRPRTCRGRCDEDVDGQEEGIAGMDPAGSVGRETSGRNDTVEVRMSQQVLSPRYAIPKGSQCLPPDGGDLGRPLE